MSDLVPVSANRASLLDPLSGASGGSMSDRLKAFTAQPAVRKALPWFAGMAGIGVLALTWAAMSPAPQRVLYSSLSDTERADVVSALDKASIGYTIDNATGTLTVDEGDLYRARMLVASDGALAAPESGKDLLDSLPMGASRTLEGDRLRAAQERDLTLTIMEIDGVEAVRVHLAKAERSVFVRDNLPPSASVMVRMARGRELSDSQVSAIANLVAGSVPGLSADSVRIVDQHGRLVSQPKGAESDRLDMQARMEDKLRSQVEQLLAPMVGTENFSSEIQVELDMNEVTSARESYDKEGAVRRETTQESQSASNSAIGVPGVLSNTPPPSAEAVPGAPGNTPATAPPAQMGESSASRTYELGREVAVSNTAPGGLKRLSVAVALNQDALKGASAADIRKFEQLISAAVGANTQRGDNVAVIVRAFQPAEMPEPPFWEASWFPMLVRNGVALLSVLLVLLLAVRPAIKAFTRKQQAQAATNPELAVLDEDGVVIEAGERRFEDERRDGPTDLHAEPRPSPASTLVSREERDENDRLASQIELAQRIAREQPADALQALRRMLGEDNKTGGAPA
ncbi:flagellar M-ring protein FliF [Altererythrobacter xixiisoli]|uniref:Flagellar M-ring protein n=1 Tax=Croceibacterium xixiisoli TaxID=1476466 RepID=A0A6I4TTK5_9SPHN|nr:flagellar basal-body MS-ring/collar protein FliF [Croceibacterium xixiisoli]MXO98461.1 flagellar M-ring protein FliF [Croceibacterium xixiisoli]